MDPAREKSDYDFAWFRLEPWHSTNFHHFQAPVASMLESLAEHTAGSRKSASITIPWFSNGHLSAQMLANSRSTKFGQIEANSKFSTERSGRIVEDWLGVLHEVWQKPDYDCLQQAELTRFLERDGRLPWGLLPGEDYFENISLLEAVTAARDDFVVVEASSFRGFWALKAVKAYSKWLRRSVHATSF